MHSGEVRLLHDGHSELDADDERHELTVVTIDSLVHRMVDGYLSRR